MPTYVAFLRAVNVGGTGKLPMAELRALCESIGLTKVRTYIASGNVVFHSPLSESAVKTRLERCLEAYAGKPVGVLVRTGDELAAVLQDNPFKSAAPNRTVAIFLDTPPPADALASATGRQSEAIALGTREIYVHYGDGMARSKLKIPATQAGTARNINTITTLVAWAAE
ncbi:hypothetical protein LMG7141_01974 [Ralstonia condita]|jgi:uncharacterized protein (DUF1697 family)|uniref:DUF1697 domain-containing protein n=1 Tax=Ralstonia condita TaxID=3058600 RepID=A0ABM9JAG7_9RALS|nr:DUF1697 domain-containing protein [Ralstonia sp. LMG 7141]MDE2201845.1 DUF1697 domain-containing protein [Burkholderiaceae bacterium]CAJ0787692.1 hypothetical protein LMG7141_01974 [Ralstonia sp. LMG 7141]